MTASSAGALGLFVAGLLLPRATRKPLELLCLAPFVMGATLAKWAQGAEVSTQRVHVQAWGCCQQACRWPMLRHRQCAC